MEAPLYDVSFSPDMAKGVLLYLITKHDKTATENWVKWIDAARPCLAQLGNNCLLAGWPRFCRDDAADKRCTFRPANCDLIEKVGSSMGITDAAICRKGLATFGIRSDYILPSEELAAGGALVNDLGYPAHLAGCRDIHF